MIIGKFIFRFSMKLFSRPISSLLVLSKKSLGFLAFAIGCGLFARNGASEALENIHISLALLPSNRTNPLAPFARD